jgi:DNA-binding HxlR family transcriptional regulator
MARNTESSLSCPVITTQNLIGGKWKILIIYALGQGTKRFGELQRSLPGITQAALTQQLRELERDALVHREVYPVVPPKVEYSLTPIGSRLDPVMDAMCAWGAAYLAETGGAKPKQKEPSSA